MFDVNPLVLKLHLKDIDRQFENRHGGRPLAPSHGTWFGRAFSSIGQRIPPIRPNRAVSVATTVVIAVLLLV